MTQCSRISSSITSRLTKSINFLFYPAGCWLRLRWTRSVSSYKCILYGKCACRTLIWIHIIVRGLFWNLFNVPDLHCFIKITKQNQTKEQTNTQHIASLHSVLSSCRDKHFSTHICSMWHLSIFVVNSPFWLDWWSTLLGEGGGDRHRYFLLQRSLSRCTHQLCPYLSDMWRYTYIYTATTFITFDLFFS